MEIKRDLYLQRLIDRMHNGMIKVVTGIRRCGKSYLILTTTFVLALGADLPWEDYLYPGNLRFSAGRDLTSLFVTYTCILSSISSSTSREYAFIS